MKKSRYVLLIIMVLASFSGQHPLNGQVKSVDNLLLWYQEPASSLGQGLKVGNGRLGATMQGGIEEERIGLNHTWLWRKWKLGGLKNPEVAHHLPAIRQLFFDGKPIEGEATARKLLGVQDIIKPGGTPAENWDSPYKNFGPDNFTAAGDLNIVFPGHTDVSGYRRSLDVATGVVEVSYEHKGIRYTREAFASFADSLIVVKITADRPGAVSAKLDHFRIPDNYCALNGWASENRIGFEGEFIEKLKFAATTAVFVEGGSTKSLVNESKEAALWSMVHDHNTNSRTIVRVGRPEISVAKADNVLILISLATDYESANPRQLSENVLDRIGEHPDYNTLLSRHIENYQSMMNRVSISLEGEDNSHIPTDERLRAYRDGKEDPQLVAQMYQHSRMILMSSSQPGGAPANLTGIWTDMLIPRWAGDIHHDDGFHNKYWHAQVCNLPESVEPLFDYLDRCIEPGREAAKNLYGCQGIFIPLTNDAWARCLKVEYGLAEWTGSAAWLGQHYWWAYEYRGDESFLRERAYPYLKEVALFFEDYLVPDPRKDSRHFGKLVTVPSLSPENRYMYGSEKLVYCIGSTSDLQMIYDVLTHCIEASKVLGIDEDKREIWENILSNIPPLQIGKHGQLQEWLEDYEEAWPGHRHVSHLYGLFPGDQITVEETPDFADASRVSLERRWNSRGETGNGGFSGYTDKMWARLQEGERALKDLHRGRISAATVSEMILQSHNDQIRLLPALPKAWPTGSVQGLRARGGFEVNIEWKNGELETAAIRSDLGRKCRIRTKIPLQVRNSKGRSVKTVLEEPGLMVFSTEKGQEYRITQQH